MMIYIVIFYGGICLCPQKGPQAEFPYALRDGHPEERTGALALQAPQTIRNESATA
ncbi:TPA: hypothetical protein ACSP3E_003821 [Aeromonas veronii]